MFISQYFLGIPCIFWEFPVFPTILGNMSISHFLPALFIKISSEIGPPSGLDPEGLKTGRGGGGRGGALTAEDMYRVA